MPRKTVLHALQKSAGAAFQEHQGWEVAETFTDPLEEVRSVRNQAAIFDLSHRGALHVSGSDRIRFLQGMVTNDVEALAPGQGCHAALLTPKGKVLADFWIYRQSEGVRIEVETGLLTQLKEILEKHIIADDVRLEDRTGSFATLSIQGPDSARIVRQMIPGELPTELLQSRERGEGDGRTLITRRSEYTAEEGFEIRLPSSAAGELWDRFLGTGIRPAGMAAMEILRIESGVPRAGIDMDESTLALEASLNDAISHTKGCYIGQEFVARIRDRGQVRRRFTGFRLQGPFIPSAGDPVLREETAAGIVTSAAFSPTLNSSIALGYLRRELVQEGERIVIRSGGKTHPAVVTSLPFIHRHGPSPREGKD